MKKILLIAATIYGLQLTAQSTIALFRHNTTTPVTANQIIYATTKKDTLTTTTIDVQNTASVTNTYMAKRYDIVLHKVNPANEDTARANLCFAGNCFGPETFVSLFSLTLTPGQNSSSLAQYYSLDCDLWEAKSKIGFSMVKYTVYNENNVNDSIQFAIRYNETLFGLGVKKQDVSNAISFYPNPVKDHAVLSLGNTEAKDTDLKIYNSIGKLVYSKKLLAANHHTLDLSELAAGIYIAEIKEGNTVSTKKLIIE